MKQTTRNKKKKRKRKAQETHIDTVRTQRNPIKTYWKPQYIHKRPSRGKSPHSLKHFVTATEN